MCREEGRTEGQGVDGEAKEHKEESKAHGRSRSLEC